MLEYGTVPIIVVACYLIVQAIKATPLNSKWYPVVSGSVGAIVALILYFAVPDFIGISSWASALIVGVASGLAATGSNQVFKQLYKAAEEGSLVVTSDEHDSDDNEETKEDMQ